MKKLALIMTMAATACGSDKGSGGGDASTLVKQGESESPAPGTEGTMPAMFATVLDLPACAAESEGALVYIKAAKQFNVCANGQWEVIDLRGDKGDVGAQGERGSDGLAGRDGAKGDTGSQGAQGVQGVAGVKGDKGDDGSDSHVIIPNGPNVWYDPIAKRHWTMAIIQTSFTMASTEVCNNGWRLPTKTEAKVARQRGICEMVRFDCGMDLWLQDGSNYNILTETSKPKNLAGFFDTACVEDK